MIARLLISPSLENRVEEINRILASHIGSGKPFKSHPDVLYFASENKLGIAEARIIKEHFSLKPYSAKGRVVILEDGSKLTDEAQNALLKTLEELPVQGLFILGADSDAKLLPTVVSRCQIIRIQNPEFRIQNLNYKEDIEKLVNSRIEARFEYIEKLTDREEFFHSLMDYFHKQLPAHTEFTKELLQAEEWAKQNVNIRAILEYLMLVMPQKL